MATFYVDVVNGKDKPSTSLATASNPSGTIVKISYPYSTKHDLQTGEQVVLSQFTAWLNATWTITVIDEYSFTLNGANWQATADSIGTCTPVSAGNNGNSWATAWRKPKASALSAGDTVLIKKTPDPTSLGNATWTHNSNKITFAGAVTKLIEICALTTGWVGSTGVTVSVVTGRKFGSGSTSFSISATATTGKMAYKPLAGTLDLSSYVNVCLWFLCASTVAAQNDANYSICLCSDTSGNTIVNQFYLPKVVRGGWYTPMTFLNGAALGNNINSIALYRDVDIASSVTLAMNDIFATNELTLDTVFGKSNTIGAEWFAPGAIIDSDVYFDNTYNTGQNHCTYYGDTETVTTYVRKTEQLLADSGVTNTPIMILKEGTEGNKINYLFGVNPINDEQDGETWLNGWYCWGTMLTAKWHNAISNVGIMRSLHGITYNTNTTPFESCDLTNVCVCSTANVGISVGNCNILNNVKTTYTYANGFEVESGNQLTNIRCIGAGYTGITLTFGLSITGGNNIGKNIVLGHCNTTGWFCTGALNEWTNVVQFSSNPSYQCDMGTTNVYKDCNFDSSTIFYSKYTNNVFIDCILGNSLHYPGSKTMYINTNTGIVQTKAFTYTLEFLPNEPFGNRTGVWRITNSAIPMEYTYSRNNITFPIAEIAVTAGVETVITLQVKKDIASAGNRLIIAKKNNIVVNEDVSVVLSDNTEWHTETLTFTPILTGVATIEILCDTNNANLKFTELSVTP